MNLKEVSELRRRFRMDRNAISRIYGCFVNSSREIVSYIDESLGILPQDEAEKYLNLLKKEYLEQNMKYSHLRMEPSDTIQLICHLLISYQVKLVLQLKSYWKWVMKKTVTATQLKMKIKLLSLRFRILLFAKSNISTLGQPDRSSPSLVSLL